MAKLLSKLVIQIFYLKSVTFCFSRSSPTLSISRVFHFLPVRPMCNGISLSFKFALPIIMWLSISSCLCGPFGYFLLQITCLHHLLISLVGLSSYHSFLNILHILHVYLTVNTFVSYPCLWVLTSFFSFFSTVFEMQNIEFISHLYVCLLCISKNKVLPYQR